MTEEKNIFYMQRALDLASKGAGMVSPNPLVGAVLVKDNTIIGEGYHQRYGKEHAEINAIDSATDSVHGATLYCNLEPCCHTDKQTPPCVDRIIKDGIKRVIIASQDPNPKVNGKGITLLKEAGIDVISGILDSQNKEINRFYIKYVTQRMPYVTVKIAQTIDGYITKEKNKQEWITGDEVTELVHQWRAAYDAVLVGANTIRIDNSRLTVSRLEGRNPVRVVISGSLNLDPKMNLFREESQEKTWVITSEESNSDRIKSIADTGCRVISMRLKTIDKISPIQILEYLAQQKITSVIVEGGQQIFSQFVYNGFADELKIFIAPILWGKGISVFTPIVNHISDRYHLISSEMIGNDALLTYRLKK